MNPYDLSTYVLDKLTTDSLAFNFLSSRNVTVVAADGWVENPPVGTDITGRLLLNDVEIVGSSVTVTEAGAVTVSFTPPINLTPGDRLTILMNDDSPMNLSDRASGLGIIFEGTEDDDTDIDGRYDVSFFVGGYIPTGRVISAAPAVRDYYLSQGGSFVVQGTELTTSPIVFLIQKNEVTVGTLSLDTGTTWTLVLFNTNENFVTGDLLSILSPGAVGSNVDDTLKDLSITFRGFLGSS